ncbi:MAG: hypothetical protein SPK03_06995 [Alloprevotella sp.]|nr:hypothetical protein [Alloprevotella sp.]
MISKPFSKVQPCMDGAGLGGGETAAVFAPARLPRLPAEVRRSGWARG